MQAFPKSLQSGGLFNPLIILPQRHCGFSLAELIETLKNFSPSNSSYSGFISYAL